MKTNILKKMLLAATVPLLLAAGCKKVNTTAATTDSNNLNVSKAHTTFGVPVLVIPPAITNWNEAGTGVIQHLTTSNDYKVELKLSTSSTWLPAFVYKSDNYAVNVSGSERRAQTSASFMNFSFSGGSVDVRVTIINSTIPLSSVIIRPLQYGVTPALDVPNKRITFTLASPKKLSIEFNNRLNPLFLFSDAPETDPGTATHYYAAGHVYNIGFRTPIHSNETIYIAGGAVVQGTFAIDAGATNVKFSGHGILTSGNVVHQDNVPAHLFNNSTFAGASSPSNAVSNCSWDGLMVVNSAAYVFGCISSYGHASHYNTWTDLKEVQWNPNTDPLWFDGDNNSASDLFLFCNDDFTTHGSTTFTVTNMVYWQGGNGGHLFFTNNYSSSDGITYDTIYVIGNDNVHQMFYFSGTTGTLNIHCNGITFKNIWMESTRNNVAGTYWENHLLDIVPQGNNTASNWYFTNFYVANQNTTSATSEGTIFGNYLGAPFDITTVHFTNFNMGTNTPCFSQTAAHIQSNGYATDVTFH